MGGIGTGHATATAATLTATETALRERLGVPAAADRVVVVAESTHWDPNWLLTSKEYFRLMVGPTLDRALDSLAAEPRRIYSLECAFFPDLYWTARPERREQFRDLVNSGRLRFTGSGVTTPDTLLPEDELLLRDLALGQQWLRDRAMVQEPRALYLPDSFGHSPGLPSLLAAAGVPYAAICRIDGMRFPAAELENAAHFPVPGTSAATLIDAASADFVWKGPDGSEVLTHWHAFGYGHGDMIGSGGLTRALGLPLAWPSRTERKVAARVERFVEQLAALARTPYLLLSIGIDFARPIANLVDLLDTWNTHGYDRTGIWLVNAGLDDYLDLVAEHRSELPTLSLDPNPYWTGFYSTRPRLKRACRDLGRALIAADHDRAVQRVAGDATPDDPPRDDSAADRNAPPSPWWIAATSNHHDFVTGTSPDRVAKAEQWPWLVAAGAEAGQAIPPPLPARAVQATPASSDEPAGAMTWRREGTLVVVTTPHLVATFDEAAGGSLAALVDIDGRHLAHAGTLALTAYVGRGGLWRMGHEFPGGRWQATDSTRAHRASVTVARTRSGLRVTAHGQLEGRHATIVTEVSTGSPELVVRTVVTPRLRRTVTLAVHSAAPIDGLAMHQPGGIVERPLQRRYTPTFWPLHSWAAAHPRDDTQPAVVVSTAVPTGLHATPDGLVEVIVARNAPRELAYGVIPLLGPATGHEAGAHLAEVAFGWSPAGRDDIVAAGRRLWATADRAAGRTTPDWLVRLDDDQVEVLAVKVASHGDGLIVRLRNWAAGADGSQRAVTMALAPDTDARITGAWLTDSNERDLEAVPVDSDGLRLSLDRTFTTLRIDTTR